MKTHLLAFGLAAATLVGLATTASAGPITLVAGGSVSSGSIPSGPGGGTNETLPLFGIAPTGFGFGYFGYEVDGTAGQYRVDVYGAEANFRNEFRLGSSTIYTHPGGTVIAGSLAAPLVSTTFNHAGGLINFSFAVNGGPIIVSNGSNPNDKDPGAPQNFFATFDPGIALASQPLTGNGLYIFLDDGNQVDDNHDDLVVKITALNPNPTPAPEPATLALFGVGLLGLGAARRALRRT
ncbi:MAG: PEP-CTERM sorting domain-containing protein [Acetobacteraceae bacterium]|nr:PEP-CTERM sorting domain-containing protein [Acetobacteraceae bacterium]